MLTWKRPQKHHHAKERIFPVISVQKLSKSVHGARRNPKFSSFFFCTKKKKEVDSDHPFKLKIDHIFQDLLFFSKIGDRIWAGVFIFF